MFKFEYSVTLTPDESDGGYVVTLPDFPEVVTQAETVEEALSQAEDALDEAVANRIQMQMDLPLASPAPEGAYVARVPVSTALKASFYQAIKELSLSKVQLAALLGVDEKEVRRLLDPRHPSKLTRIEELLRRLDKRIVISIEDAEPVAIYGSQAVTSPPMEVREINNRPANPRKTVAREPSAENPTIGDIAS
jgi:antitoxin HicB